MRHKSAHLVIVVLVTCRMSDSIVTEPMTPQRKPTGAGLARVGLHAVSCDKSLAASVFVALTITAMAENVHTNVGSNIAVDVRKLC